LIDYGPDYGMTDERLEFRPMSVWLGVEGTVADRLKLRATFETLVSRLFRDMTNQGVLGSGMTRLDPGR
jgi:hypothetical protein